MEKSLENKLTTFNPQRPYVWEMKITESEFVSLEEDLCHCTPYYDKKSDALKVLVYLAEWYKRRYTNKTKKAYQKTFNDEKPDLTAVWKVLGIDKRYLYEGENGQKLYLYSTFILSGLAVKFERQKNEKPFLRALCRVYNKKDDSFDRVIDNNHSIAFKESIAQSHCLRDFLEAIITSQNNTGKLPYAKEDIKNADTEIALLIELIREINYEVNKSKFRLEWVVSAVPGDNLVSRRLHIWLNPEEKGKLHQLLRIDRLKKWGFEQPEDMCYIRLGVRYWNGAKVVKEPDFHHPELYYRNTGDSNIGFICEKADYANCNNVPTVAFDKVQLIAWNEDGTELPIPVQEETIDFDAMQLYRVEAGEDDWTSRTLQQRETALLFTDKWTIADHSVDKSAEKKTYYNKRQGEGDTLYWCYIHASVTIKNENESRTFYDRQGYDHIVVRQYKETIQYTEDGKVLLHESDDMESPETVTPISLMFRKEDVIAYHTETKDEGDEDVCEETKIELYEFKKGNKYVVWSEAERPEPGYVDLRLTVKGKASLFKVFYVPKTIVRDLDKNTIQYCYNGKDEIHDDKEAIETAIRRRQILEPTVSINVGAENSYVTVPVYRPVSLKEVCYDGKILKYVDEDVFELPYILHNHITLHCYDANGYEEYCCSNLAGLHKLIYKKRPNNKNSAWASSAAWENGDVLNAKEMDATAPDFLKVKIGERQQSEISMEEFYFWDYNANHLPCKMPRRGIKSPEEWGMIFQSNKKNQTCKNYYPLINEEDDDIFDEVDHFEDVSIILCFKIAIEHEQYFFTFTPLKGLTEKDFEKEIIEPLCSKYGNEMPQNIRAGIRRFIEEFDYDIDKYFTIIN